MRADFELLLCSYLHDFRADILDSALLRPGRIDRKIEFPLPNEAARARILEIHSRKMTVGKDVNYEELSRSTDEFNGAQLKAVCVEAGMIALREGATMLSHEHFLSGIAEGMSSIILKCGRMLMWVTVQYKARRRTISCTSRSTARVDLVLYSSCMAIDSRLLPVIRVDLCWLMPCRPERARTP